MRAPARIDVAALVKARGAVEARHDLELQIVAHPSDLGARLALAALDDQVGRPSGAIEQLEAVLVAGGPLGTRWHPDDRARLARLLAARGRARLTRGAPSSHADLTRARELGAKIEDGELSSARLAHAIAQLRHIDAGERAAGKQVLVELYSTPIGDPSWRGAGTNATAGDHGALGVWLWTVGARRAAWEELAAWHDATPAPRDEALASAYLVARTWWAPSDAAPPADADLVGPQRCRFATCNLWELAMREPRDDAAIAAAIAAPRATAATASDAAAWVSITLTQALHGEAEWGPAFAARVDVAAIATTALPPQTQLAFARLAGRRDGAEATLAEVELATGRASHATRLVMAAGRALRNAPAAEVRAVLGPEADTDDGRALLRIVDLAPPPTIASPLATAVVDHVRTHGLYGPDATVLRRIADAYVRDPAIADRLALDAVAEAPDAAPAHAAVAAMFDALGDPGRARASWQAAVDSSPEIEYVRRLAETMARANDPDAALITATTAAAAWGDPAIVWTSVARALESAGKHVHALEAARSAIDLAGPVVLPDALDVAIAASRELGRDDQAAALLARRARLAPPPAGDRDDDPTAASAALAEFRRRATVGAIARMWVASRWNPRDVAIRDALRTAIAADDPRRRVIEAELVALASDRDPDVGRAAVAALR